MPDSLPDLEVVDPSAVQAAAAAAAGLPSASASAVQTASSSAALFVDVSVANMGTVPPAGGAGPFSLAMENAQMQIDLQRALHRIAELEAGPVTAPASLTIPVTNSSSAAASSRAAFALGDGSTYTNGNIRRVPGATAAAQDLLASGGLNAFTGGNAQRYQRPPILGSIPSAAFSSAASGPMALATSTAGFGAPTSGFASQASPFLAAPPFPAFSSGSVYDPAAAPPFNYGYGVPQQQQQYAASAHPHFQPAMQQTSSIGHPPGGIDPRTGLAFPPLPVAHKHPVLPAHYASELDVYRTRELETYTAELDLATGQQMWVAKRAESADKKLGPVPKNQLLSKIVDFPLYNIATDRCRRVLVERGWPMDGHDDFSFEMQRLRHEVPLAPFVEFLELDQLLRCRNHYDGIGWTQLILQRDVLRYIAMFSQAAPTAGAAPAQPSKPKTKAPVRVEFVDEAHGITCGPDKCRTFFNLGRCGRGDKCKFVESHGCEVPGCPDPKKHGTAQHKS